MEDETNHGRTNIKDERTRMKTKITTLCLALCLGLPVVITGLTGCAGDRYQRSTGEYIDDKALTMRVKSALGDNPEYKFSDVEVKSFKGTVQLAGFVNTGDQKKKAAQIAEKVQGVKNVENNITVKP
jgi:osmotically-inducible protein OsmY